MSSRAMGEWCAADTDLGLPEIGAQMRAGRVNPTCMDRYAHHVREGPGTAAHRFATLALHRIRDTKCAYLSAYGVKPAHDDV
jgi:hypothetical protein